MRKNSYIIIVALLVYGFGQWQYKLNLDEVGRALCMYAIIHCLVPVFFNLKLRFTNKAGTAATISSLDAPHTEHLT